MPLRLKSSFFFLFCSNNFIIPLDKKKKNFLSSTLNSIQGSPTDKTNLYFIQRVLIFNQISYLDSSFKRKQQQQHARSFFPFSLSLSLFREKSLWKRIVNQIAKIRSPSKGSRSFLRSSGTKAFPRR